MGTVVEKAVPPLIDLEGVTSPSGPLMPIWFAVSWVTISVVVVERLVALLVGAPQASGLTNDTM